MLLSLGSIGLSAYADGAALTQKEMTFCICKVEDTIGIMLYAYSQIMREDSPIENIVLDLSCNTGGDADTAVFTTIIA